MSAHLLALPSGGNLDLDCLPPQATLEMLQVCRDRIFALEGQLLKGAVELQTPAKAARKSAPDSASKSSASKALSQAQIAKEKKSIVKDIKKRITPLKFHTGFDRVEREVKFAADRLPPEAAEQVLRMSRDAWTAPTITATLEGNEAVTALSLEADELKGSVWLKGGAQPGRRFGAVKPKRLGSAALLLKSMMVSYTVKSQRLTGSIRFINGPTASGSKRQHSDAFDDLFACGFGVELTSASDDEC